MKTSRASTKTHAGVTHQGHSPCLVLLKTSCARGCNGNVIIPRLHPFGKHRAPSAKLRHKPVVLRVMLCPISTAGGFITNPRSPLQLRQSNPRQSEGAIPPVDSPSHQPQKPLAQGILHSLVYVHVLITMKRACYVSQTHSIEVGRQGSPEGFMRGQWPALNIMASRNYKGDIQNCRNHERASVLQTVCLLDLQAFSLQHG